MSSLLRRLVPDFSRVTAELNKKPRNHQLISFNSFTQAETDAVENLKTLLKNPLILELPLKNPSI